MQPHSNNTTSLDAAKQIEPNSGTLEEKVLLAIRKAGATGMTDQEIQKALGMNPNTQRPRRGTLHAKNLIADSGRTRHTASGRSAIVWVDKKFSPNSGGPAPRVRHSPGDSFADDVRRVLGVGAGVSKKGLLKRIEALKALEGTGSNPAEEFSVVNPDDIAEGNTPSPQQQDPTPSRRSRLSLPDRVEGLKPSWFRRSN